VHNPDQPDSELSGPDRYAFTPPEVPAGSAPRIEFKKVRRARHQSPQAGPTTKDKRHRRKWIIVAAAGLVVMLLASTGIVGLQGWRAKGHLETAAGLFVQLQQQIGRADVSAAKGTLSALRIETKAAHDETDGIGWAIGGRLPFVGGNLQAVRTVSAVLDDLAENGLPALLDVAAGLDPTELSPRNGRVDVSALTSAGPRIAAGLTVIRKAQSDVAGIRTDGLVGQIGIAVGQLSGGLAKAEHLIASADRAARLLPRMLGADGPRTYLVLFQNNAEIRATGGMPGAYIVIRADAGAVTIADQGTAAGDIRIFEPPVTKLDANLEALYTDRPAVFPADVNLTPDFPTAARLFRAMYQKRSGIAVDGVLATDPVALSYLLRVTGAVKVPEGEPLTANNAVRVLLSEAYAKYPNPANQDAYFAGAARATFAALLKGQGDPRGIITQLARAAGERRLLMWSTHQDEQADIAGTVLEGRLPADDGGAPTVGLFLNDGSGGKLSYYLTMAAQLSAGGCTGEGGRELHLKFTVGSTAPGAGLPAYVTGLALSGQPYTSRTNVMIFSPIGGGVERVASNGKDVSFGTGLERDRGVAVLTVDLAPGSSRTYEVTIQTGQVPRVDAPVSPRLWTTPGVRPWKTAVTPGPRCS
jgi:hypothetical protein